jgi:hypothetical protein
MSNISDKLRLIMEGNLLLEAEEDKYDLDNNTDNKDATPTDNQDSTSTDPTGDTGSDTGSTDDSTSGTGDDTSGNYDLGDDGSDDSGDDGPATSDNTTADDSTTDPAPTDTQPAVGEVLNIDPKTRAILAFKNFERYRDLRDDTNRLITELSEFIPLNDQIRDMSNVAIEKSTDLVNKLNDYILYKYNDTSYELNYYNFMQFILEKRYLTELYDKIINSSSQVKGNK